MHIVIIGNGISGVTAARHIRKKDSSAKITIISAETPYFFSRTALMYIYMGHMKFEHTQPYEKHFWPKNNIELVHDYVEKVDFEGKKLIMKKEPTISYDKLILATGSKPNQLTVKGSEAKAVQGLYSYQDLQAMEEYSSTTKRAVIVGGGLIGIEMAEMFLSRGIQVTFLVRENSFWNSVLPVGESEMINRHIRNHHVDLRLSTELDEIIQDSNGRVAAVKIKDGEQIDCQFVGMTIGVHPNISFLKDSSLETNKGILVNSFFETNHKDVYAIGDCAEFKEALPNRRSVEQVWYTGRMHGETLAYTITGKPTPYTPSHWFNSAKFFDIEYQTYGFVPPHTPSTMKSLYWEHPKGEKCIHLVYEKNSRKLLGVNVLGIRYRHAMFERWLNEERTIEQVLKHLHKANFDPEFFKTFEHEVVALYNSQNPENVISYKKKKRFLDYFGL